MGRGRGISLGPQACAHLRHTFVSDLSVYSSGMGLNTPSLHSHHSPFSPHRSSPLNPLHYHFPSLSHLLFVLSSITSNAGTKGAEQKPRPQNRPITNINLKRCWSAESTFMHKDNLGSLFSLVPPTLPALFFSGGILYELQWAWFSAAKEEAKRLGVQLSISKGFGFRRAKDFTLAIMREGAVRLHSLLQHLLKCRGQTRSHTHTVPHTNSLLDMLPFDKKQKRQMTIILL